MSDGQHGVDPHAPVCPAFKEIGEKYGGFDLGLIPIGYVFPPACDSACSDCYVAERTIRVGS